MTVTKGKTKIVQFNKDKDKARVIPFGGGYYEVELGVFFASLNWRKLQSVFGECCISKMAKVAMA